MAYRVFVDLQTAAASKVVSVADGVAIELWGGHVDDTTHTTLLGSGTSDANGGSVIDITIPQEYCVKAGAAFVEHRHLMGIPSNPGSLVLASSSAPAALKAFAFAVLDGIADEVDFAAAIAALPNDGSIIAVGPVTFDNPLSITKAVNIKIWGDFTYTKATGAAFNINTPTNVYHGGIIEVTGTCYGSADDVATMLVSMDFARNWDMRFLHCAGSPNRFGVLWKINGATQVSNQWLYGNSMKISGWAKEHIWQIASINETVAKCFIEGNTLEALGSCNALQPILFEAGLFNTVIGAPGPLNYDGSETSTSPDIKDRGGVTDSRGQNIFILTSSKNMGQSTNTIVQDLVEANIHETSILLGTRQTRIPRQRVSLHNLIGNATWERWPTSSAPAEYTIVNGTAAIETTEVYFGNRGLKFTGHLTLGSYAYWTLPSWFLAFLNGKIVTLGVWMKCDTNGKAMAILQDTIAAPGGAQNSQSYYHPGDNDWHYIQVTRRFRTGLTGALIRPIHIVASDPAVVVYVGPVSLTVGVSGSILAPSPITDRQLARGTTTVPAGGTTKVVTHTLPDTPTSITLTFVTWGNSTRARVSSRGTSTFTITVDVDPAGAGADIDWIAML